MSSKSLVRAISDQAYGLLLDRARRDDATDKHTQAVSALITQLDGSRIPKGLVEQVIKDESLPLGDST